jgi:hypothetical protein
MPWPPQVGELLPRFDEPIGIERKLNKYSLVPKHKVGGPKANGFLVMLGIDLLKIDYLAQEIRTGIARTPISVVRLIAPGEARCTVQFQIAGPDRYSHRTASLRTGWEVAGPTARPRMVTAFLRGKEER